MTRRFWTDEIIDRFCELCRRGCPRDRIAADLGWSVKQVTRLNDHLRRKGCQPYRLAFGATWHPSPLHGRETEIRLLSMAGLGTGRIAAHFGVSRNTAASFMDRYGLYAPHRRKGRRRLLPVSLARYSFTAADYEDADLRAGRALAEACG